eukprot:5750687-Amphidinium_carterae.1
MGVSIPLRALVTNIPAWNCGNLPMVRWTGVWRMQYSPARGNEVPCGEQTHASKMDSAKDD